MKIKCVFLFSLELLFQTFRILRRIQWDIVINVKTYPCKVPVIPVRFQWNLNFLTDFRKKSLNMKFNQNPSSGSRVVPCGRTDRQT